jgi:hypothetical protein
MRSSHSLDRPDTAGFGPGRSQRWLSSTSQRFAANFEPTMLACIVPGFDWRWCVRGARATSSLQGWFSRHSDRQALLITEVPVGQETRA